MERIENHIYARGLFTEAEERQLVQQLTAFAEKPDYEGRAKTLLAKLYNNQAEQYRMLAVTVGKEAAENAGDPDAISELANAWGSYIPDWCVRNHHALIAWFSDYCRRHPDNRSAVMWLLDNLIADRRLAEARDWLEKLARIDRSFRVPMYRYQIALAAGDAAEVEQQLQALESLAESEWCCATTLGDIYTQRQDYDRAVAWYRKGQALQPSPKYTDSAMSIAHICEIRGDKAGAIAAYREVLRLMREEWGIVSGEEREDIERAIRALQ